ncbi:MAG: hypothetical protein LBR60_01235 [Fibrobacter sp.]|nr:hypothetical protein [Fibrobacter sp.]
MITQNGKRYDTAALYVLAEVLEFYENGESNSYGELSGEWTYAGLAGEGGIFDEMERYFYTNKVKIPVIRERIHTGS